MHRAISNNPNTGAVLIQDGHFAAYLRIVLGSDCDIESENEAAKAEESAERNLFLAAVRETKKTKKLR